MRRRSFFRLASVAIGLLVALCAAALAASTVWSVTHADSNSARLVSSYRWHEDAPWFGGMSGLELSEDGTRFVAITDRSHLVKGEIIRQDGDITGLRMTEQHRLRDAGGARMPEDVEDSEGLVVQGARMFVSFESPHRVLEYNATEVRQLPSPRGFRRFSFNASFEALAQSPEGYLLLIAESPPRNKNVSRVWRWSGAEGWQGLGPYPEADGFLPVGADFGPDGALYVLERKFAKIGFRSRLRRFDLTAKGLGGGEILLNTPLARHDNLEGLSIWRTPSGSLRATMISDDNFFWVQRTELVEYDLPARP
ncbi:esterase-like activity of phytase family protein [Tritonibacter mobilis]|nr:esterase-like activity of phytase family protein [Tritonibacter mobilis]